MSEPDYDDSETLLEQEIADLRERLKRAEAERDAERDRGNNWLTCHNEAHARLSAACLMLRTIADDHERGCDFCDSMADTARAALAAAEGRTS